MRLFYASRDGQSLKISTYIAAKLATNGIKVVPEDLAAIPAAADALSGRNLLVIVASVRYGHHLEPADRFLAAYRRLNSEAPLVILSVNLTARKANKKTAQNNPYLRKWLRRYNLTPAYAAAIAGRLDYPRYSWFDRTMIRFIMLLTGGPTDPQAVVEFTDWKEVDDATTKIAEIAAVSPPPCGERETATATRLSLP
jgi:menaquinone-dependent protoporphyrinogen oxidase